MPRKSKKINVQGNQRNHEQGCNKEKSMKQAKNAGNMQEAKNRQQVNKTGQNIGNPGVLLLIDSNSILHRAYHAYPLSLVTGDGKSINAVYGFASMVLDALLKVKPQFVVCAFDTKAPTFRHTEYTGYKAKRPKTDETLITQVQTAHEFVKKLDIPLMLMEGYEADDILATIAKTVQDNPDYKNQIKKILILTSDRDLFALVNNYVHVLMPQGSFKNLKEFGPKDVYEKMGIHPNQVYDYKALAGDSSDNIPGVRGVGDKTAKDLLTKYKNLDNIYKHLDEIAKTKKAVANKLAEDHQNAILSYKLATIKQDVPIVFDINKARLTDFNYTQAYKFFTQLEFKSLIKKLKEFYIFVTGKEPEEQSSQKPEFTSTKKAQFKIKDVKTLTLNPGNPKNITQIIEIFDTIAKHGRVEQSRVEKSNANSNIATSTGTNTPTYIFYYNKADSTLTYTQIQTNKKQAIKLNLFIPLSSYTKEIKQEIALPVIFYGLFEFFINIQKYLLQETNGSQSVASQNTSSKAQKVQQQQLQKLITAITSIPVIYDISAVAYALTTGRSDYSLQELATIYADLQTLPQEPQDLLNLIAIIAQNQISEIKKIQTNYKKPFTFLTIVVDPTALYAFALMHNNGINVDLNQVLDYQNLLTQKLNEIEKQIYDTVGYEFNVRSTKQLADVLFNVLKLPTFKKRKTGYSTDINTLKALYNAHPVIPLILEHRKLQKILSTYVKPYLEIARSIPDKNTQGGTNKQQTGSTAYNPKQQIPQQSLLSLTTENSKSTEDTQSKATQATIRIHSFFNPLKTSTGRLASSKPNLQNIPTRTEEGAKVREFFIPDNNKIFVKLDYSQIDLRVLAHTSKEKNMIQAFVEGKDIHRQTAAEIFDIPYEKVTDKQRRVAKTINFGIVYGMTAHGLATTLDISHHEAQDFIDRYFLKYPGILKYVQTTEKFVKKHGFVLSLFGRRRFIYGITSNNPMRRQAALREAINMPIQGGSDDILRTAIYQIFKQDEAVQQNIAKLVLQIHDELIFEVPNTPEFIGHWAGTDNKSTPKAKQKQQEGNIPPCWITKIKSIMENAVKLDVPLKVGVEVGRGV